MRINYSARRCQTRRSSPSTWSASSLWPALPTASTRRCDGTSPTRSPGPWWGPVAQKWSRCPRRRRGPSRR